MSNDPGRARNARLNQVARHAEDFILSVHRLIGATRSERVDLTDGQKEDWYRGRTSLEQMTQCFHEANAYNNCVEKPKFKKPDLGSKPKE